MLVVKVGLSTKEKELILPYLANIRLTTSLVQCLGNPRTYKLFWANDSGLTLADEGPVVEAVEQGFT